MAVVKGPGRVRGRVWLGPSANSRPGYKTRKYGMYVCMYDICQCMCVCVYVVCVYGNVCGMVYIEGNHTWSQETKVCHRRSSTVPTSINYLYNT